jgi:hypothetical protein
MFARPSRRNYLPYMEIDRMNTQNRFGQQIRSAQTTRRRRMSAAEKQSAQHT